MLKHSDVWNRSAPVATLAAAAVALIAALIPSAIARCGSFPEGESRPTPTQLPRVAVPLRYSVSVTPDASNLRFAADALIGFKLVKATDVVVLNAVDLEISTAAILDRHGIVVPVRQIVVDPIKQTATFQLGRPIEPGQFKLRIQYTGRIQNHPTGFFALDYEASTGKSRALFTQFEPADARRFLPSWDEPVFRTPFDLRVTIPANQTAISNMPARDEQLHADGTKTVAFSSTPAMSTYLFFLAVGEFDRAVTSVSGTELGIVTRAGAKNRASYALDNARRLLPFYNDYFGTPYPLPKLDNIAAPGSGQFFNAMENWGAIFTFEDYLLVDPAITSESRRRQIFSSMAHEMAHQWFGNLVTMAWWDDLWLNEGFASWMANKATAHLNPGWNALLDRIRSREAAMDLDSLRETHPIVQPIDSVDQISQSFDDITYGKAEAVIVMLENFLGDKAWRKGVREYLKTYRLRNTVTDDLWKKIEKAADRPVTAIAHDFTRQPGVPLIKVVNAQCSQNQTIATLEQDEFRSEPQARAQSTWRIPVVAAVLGGGEARTIVQEKSATMTIPGCGPLIVNAGQAGYYRTLYEPRMLEQLKSNYARLTSMDQLGLLADSWSLGLAGYQPPSISLDLVEAIPGGADPEVWKQAVRILDTIYVKLRHDPQTQALVTKYASAKLAPELNRVGWDAPADDPGPNAIVRAELIEALGKLGDPRVVDEARRRFTGQIRDPAAIDGPLKTAILAVVAANADEATWGRLWEQAKKERAPLVRSQLYTLLASSRNEDLARRALTLALSDEPGPTRSRMFEEVAKTHPELAYDFAVQNREAVQNIVDSFSRDSFIPGLASGSSDARIAQSVRDFANSHMTATSRRPADVAAATIDKNVRVRESRLPDISAWMVKRNEGATEPAGPATIVPAIDTSSVTSATPKHAPFLLPCHRLITPQKSRLHSSFFTERMTFEIRYRNRTNSSPRSELPVGT